MYAFVRKPRWVAGHVLAGVLLVIFVLAGFWQLGRHGELQDRNARLVERQGLAALNVDRFIESVRQSAQDVAALDQMEYRSVALRLVHVDWAERVLIRNRSFNGMAGCHLAVPAEVSVSGGNFGVLIVAGWLHQQSCDAMLDGEIDVADIDVADTGLRALGQVEGRVRLSQERGLLGPSDPADGRLDSLARTDVQRIDQQTTLNLAPVYIEMTDALTAAGASIQLDAQRDTNFAAPTPLPPPELNAGPHLGYAVQWFSFALVAVVGYTLVLRHQAHKGASEQVVDDWN